MSDLLEVTREGRLLRIALNRPSKRNALSAELSRELVVTLDRADADPRIGAVLLTGNGPSFCAGMDLNEILSSDAAQISRIHEQLFSIGVRLNTPVIAAVHGAALAGGTGLAVNCPVVLAAEDAIFGLTEIRLGLWPFLIFGAVVTAVGERRAVDLALTGRVISARQALEYGIVTEICPPADLAGRAAAVALGLAYSSPEAVRSGLMFVQEIRHRGERQAGEIARSVRGQALRSPDFQEGVRAFHEKRQPRWPSLAESEGEDGKNWGNGKN